MNTKLKRTLYVGIGGTGVDTLLKVKKNFIDIYGEVPPMIGFLAIDTDRSTSEKSVVSNLGKKITLEKSETLVCSVKEALMVHDMNRSAYDWVPKRNVTALSGIQGGGAGQVRSNGRFIAFYNKKKIEYAISSAITNITKLIPFGAKYEFGTNNNDVDQPIYINVVASLAGGTGSGMLVDVLYILRESLRLTKDIRLFPWIVLPEIFKTMASGPSMANVQYNTYGALRELDYFMHYDPQTPAINFGYANIKEPLFDYAYMINNTNSSGTSFRTFGEITDIVSKSMFLFSSGLGATVDSSFDNIMTQKMAGTYNIRNKKAWAASTGSAELIYDGQAVGRTYAYKTIQELCASMSNSQTDGLDDANRFVDDPDVMINEHNKDNIIDALLSPDPDQPFNVDPYTSSSDINAYFRMQCSEDQLAEDLNKNLSDKLNNTLTHFDRYIDDIMKRKQGKVEAAIKFIQRLNEIVDKCKKEMAEEADSYSKQNQIKVNWDNRLDGIKRKGIGNVFGGINNKVSRLDDEIMNVATNRREELRRNWAIKFYNAFEEKIKEKLLELDALKSALEKIVDRSKNSIQREKNNAIPTSNFQIFLHTNDIDKASHFEIDDNIKADFVSYLQNGMSSWIGLSAMDIEEKLWRFAKETPKVKSAVNTNIDSVLGALSEGEVKNYLERLKSLASPLWSYNTQGYSNMARELDKIVVIGVGNRDTSVLKNDDRFNTFFDLDNNYASFASTNWNDRIYVMVVEDLLPIYAVNNFNAYEKDYQEQVVREGGMDCYIDENINKRMIDEEFNVFPKGEE